LIIREDTEFGLDMVRGLPRVNYCIENNLEHEVYVKPALMEMYRLLTDKVYKQTHWHPQNPNDLYQHERPNWTKSEWSPPPLKEMFKGKVEFDKPTIVINNKFISELSLNAVNRCLKEHPDIDLSMDAVIEMDTFCSMNHYSMQFISKLVEEFSDKYKIIYISPIVGDNYFKDHQKILGVNDYEYLEKNHPEVYTIKEHMKNRDVSYNIAQFELESTSEKHLSLIGGNCKVSSYFGGDVIIYMGEVWKYGSPVHHDGKKGERGIFKTGSWLRHLSGANIIQFNRYKDIFKYIKKEW
tara:strand:- start:1311 stop:2198 length:888 start_codon:yes stop_codon:yes gene_type:complete